MFEAHIDSNVAVRNINWKKQPSP